MSAASTHFKLGLLAILSLAAALGVAFGLGARATRHETVRYHTYFGESVQGLEIGAPVKYRGVPIGTVDGIEVAPDHRLIDVALAVDADDARVLGLVAMPPDLRAQLGTQGITGVKLVDIDFFDPETNPAPRLSFPPAEPYIPAAPSMMKGLGDQLGTLGTRLPALVDAVVATLHDVQVMLADLHGQHLPARLARAIDDVDGAAVELRTLLRHVDRAKLPEKTARAVDGLSGAIAKIDAMLDRMGGDGGLVATAQRATENLGDLGRNTAGSTQELDRTLRDLGEAAQAIRELAQDLERDPDMLLGGRARGKNP